MAPGMLIAAREESEAWDDDHRTAEEIVYHAAEIQRDSDEEPFVVVKCLADFQAVANFPADEAYVGITRLAVLSVGFIEAPILLGKLRNFAKSEKGWTFGNLFKLREAVDLCSRVRGLEGLVTTLKTKLGNGNANVIGELDNRSVAAMRELEPFLVPLSAHQSVEIRTSTCLLHQAVEDLITHVDGGGFSSASIASRVANIQSRIDMLKEVDFMYQSVCEDEYVPIEEEKEDEFVAAEPFVRIFSLDHLISYLAEASWMLLAEPICIVRLDLASSTRMTNMIQADTHHRLGLWVGNMDLLRQASKLNVTLSGLLLSLREIEDAAGNDEMDWFQVASVSRVVNSLMPQQPTNVRGATEDLIHSVEEMLSSLPPKPEDINATLSPDCLSAIVTRVDSLIMKVTNLQHLQIVYPDVDAPLFS